MSLGAALNIADRVTAWIHPLLNQKDRIRRQLEMKTHEKNELLDKQALWTPEDSVRCNSLISDISRLERLYNQLKD